ncbi:MAG: alpha/beta fold hydrolase [Balneolaceae bacterium]
MKLIEPERILKKLELKEFPQPDLIRLKHPVLLCHGYGVMASIVKPSPMNEACMQLRSYGIAAFAPNIVPYASIQTRAKEWHRKIDKLCDQYGFEQFNVIAHSMAGLDMRYALHQEGLHDRVASLTTLATPHKGTSLAELILKTPERLQEVLGDAFNWFGNSVYPKSKSDAVGALRQLTRSWLTEQFNPEHPDLNGVAYFSYSGAVGKGTDHPLAAIYRYQNNHIFEEEGVNDAFVSRESAMHGEHLATVPLSHLEQLGLSVSKERKILFERFWQEAARTLKERGF